MTQQQMRITQEKEKRMKLFKLFTFDSAHFLPKYLGKCKNMHGHTYKLEVGIEGDIEKTGFIMDFVDVKKAIQTVVIDRYDHKLLNEFFDNPTAEIMAKSMFKELDEHFIKENKGKRMGVLRLWETPTSYVEIDNGDI